MGMGKGVECKKGGRMLKDELGTGKGEERQTWKHINKTLVIFA